MIRGRKLEAKKRGCSGVGAAIGAAAPAEQTGIVVQTKKNAPRHLSGLHGGSRCHGVKVGIDAAAAAEKTGVVVQKKKTAPHY